jgi:hypothetical protein
VQLRIGLRGEVAVTTLQRWQQIPALLEVRTPTPPPKVRQSLVLSYSPGAGYATTTRRAGRRRWSSTAPSAMVTPARTDKARSCGEITATDDRDRECAARTSHSHRARHQRPGKCRTQEDRGLGGRDVGRGLGAVTVAAYLLSVVPPTSPRPTGHLWLSAPCRFPRARCSPE